MHQEVEYVGEKTPLQCRRGPMVDRYCTDFYCCIIYLVLVAAVALLVVFSSRGTVMSAV